MFPNDDQPLDFNNSFDILFETDNIEPFIL